MYKSRDIRKHPVLARLSGRPSDYEGHHADLRRVAFPNGSAGGRHSQPIYELSGVASEPFDQEFEVEAERTPCPNPFQGLAHTDFKVVKIFR